MSVRIFRLLLNNQTLSKRSSSILHLLFNDILISETRGELKCNDSICTFTDKDNISRFLVNPNFRIPEHFIEYPKLYRIYQKNEMDGKKNEMNAKNEMDEIGKNYYQFGPSSRSLTLPFMIHPALNEVEFVETYTNQFGKPHRDDGYAITHKKNGEIVGMRLYVNGYHNVSIQPHTIVRYLKDCKELYEKTYDISKPDLSIFDKLIAVKIHRKRTETTVRVSERQVIFRIIGRNRETFQITDDPEVRKRIGTRQVLEMVEDFGNLDSEGKDMSDRFIDDYFVHEFE